MKYEADKERLFSIMHTCTSQDLHYLVTVPLHDKDGAAWYKAIQGHIHGTSNLDIRKAKRLLEDHRVNCSKPIKKNIAFIEEAIVVVDIATKLTMSDMNKIDCVQENFKMIYVLVYWQS